MIRYKAGFKYQLCAEYKHKLSFNTERYAELAFISLSDHVLKIKRGYAWDGASGPTLDTKSSMRASLIHDALYQLMREQILPQTFQGLADDELEKIGIEDGMWKVRARLWERVLAKFGGKNTRAEAKRKVHIAP